MANEYIRCSPASGRKCPLMITLEVVGIDTYRRMSIARDPLYILRPVHLILNNMPSMFEIGPNFIQRMTAPVRKPIDRFSVERRATLSKSCVFVAAMYASSAF